MIMYLDKLKEVTNIAILWYWKEGKSTLHFLLKLWILEKEITIIDKNNVILDNKNINIISWENYLDNLNSYNLIFKSPGISPYHEKISLYREKLTSQTEIFFKNYKWKTIWITATKGKSTVSTLLYETLKNADYNVKLVGNIGKPVFDEIDLLKQEKYNYIIYELSSYMLETCKPNCDIAVLWNIYTCHLDYHNNKFSTYEQSKLNILSNSDNVIISNDFNHYGQNIDNCKYFWLESEYNYSDDYFYKNNQELFSSKNLLLLWDHNKKNISSIIGILDIITEKYNNNSDQTFFKLISTLENTLKLFSGLPHRMEKIAEYDNITFIDDGISTTPESTIEAIKTFWITIDTLFLWGWDYGFTKESYLLLIDAIIKFNINNIVLFPDTGLDIFDIERWSIEKNSKIIKRIKNTDLNLFYTHSMEEAIKFSYNNTRKNNICLMSCAAPSYSLWTGYEQKWEEFKKYIEKYKS